MAYRNGEKKQSMKISNMKSNESNEIRRNVEEENIRKMK